MIRLCTSDLEVHNLIIEVRAFGKYFFTLAGFLTQKGFRGAVMATVFS